LRVSWWGGDSRHQATLDAIEIFESKYPNISIEAEYSGFDGYYQKLVTQLVAKTAPDVFQSDQGWTVEFFNRGDVFLPLEQYASVIDLSTFEDQLLNSYCRMGGHTVVVPLGFNGTVLLYNKDLLAKYGVSGSTEWTWEDMIALGRRIHADNPDAYLFTDITDGYIRFVLKPYLEQVTNRIAVTDDYSVGFSQREMAGVFSFIKELFDSGTAEPYERSVLYKVSVIDNPAWIAGNIGSTLIFLSTIARDTAGLPFEVGVGRLPIRGGAPTTGQESGPSLMFAGYANTAHPKEAAQFINFFVNDPDSILALGTVRSVPANQPALDILNNAGKVDALMASGASISAASMGFPNGALEMNPSVHSIFVQAMEQVIYGQLTPDKAAANLIADLQERLAEMKP
jgi:oligogalacturonide transport system substrate-binding protein